MENDQAQEQQLPKGGFKIEPIEVPSDECEVSLGMEFGLDKIFDHEGNELPNIINPGTTHRPHEGESIKILPITSVKSLAAVAELQQLGLKASEGTAKAAEAVKIMNAIRAKFTEICLALSKQIVWWNWTDLGGFPLEQPYRNPSSIAELSEQEIYYLIRVIQNPETKEQRKKDSESSETSSSEEGQSHTSLTSTESVSSSNARPTSRNGKTQDSSTESQKLVSQNS